MGKATLNDDDDDDDDDDGRRMLLWKGMREEKG